MLSRTFPTLLIFSISIIVLSSPTQSSEEVARWDFSQGLQGWVKNDMTFPQGFVTPEGLGMNLTGPDPYLSGPRVDYPVGQFVNVTVRMRSTSDKLGQIYFGETFTELNSRAFVVQNDGEWHEYRIPLPPLGPRFRLRLDPGHDTGKVTLAWIRVEASTEPTKELWARPKELRAKKFLGGGLYTTHGEETAITTRFLSTHPDFLAGYPFDGIVLPALLDPAWVKSLNLPRNVNFLNELLWNTIRLPESAIAPAIADIKSVRWGSVTHNFLIYGMVDGSRGSAVPDFTNDSDWAIVEQNAALAARFCREAKFQGFWLDTEQYGTYRWRTKSGVPEFDLSKPQGLPFPLGKDTPEVLRRRGKQWIKAVQKELPAIKIMISFAWSPDLNGYGPLKGVAPFLNGVLDGIEAPGQLIHAYENTFYFGHAPGTTHTKEGFPGDRVKYETARVGIREWRALSDNPKKYDEFVKVGMAAWMEDDPWNVPLGWPSGSKASFWSNLPLALAYSDEFVWVWSEHTKYGQPSSIEINPFLSSLRNQTFNGGGEQVATFVEDFASDPLQHGWYFDFDMLALGRKQNPMHEVALMSKDAVPYIWDKTRSAVLVRGETSTNLNHQRRRYVRPIQPVQAKQNFLVSFDLRIESFGTRVESPIIFGLFQSDSQINQNSLTLRIKDPKDIRLVLDGAGKHQTYPIKVTEELKAGQLYRLEFNYNGTSRLLQGTISRLSPEASGISRFETELTVADEPFSWDEVGIGLAEENATSPTRGEMYRYQLEKLVLAR